MFSYYSGNVLKFSLSLTPCVVTSYISKCMKNKDIMKEYELPVTIGGEDCRIKAQGIAAIYRQLQGKRI